MSLKKDLLVIAAVAGLTISASAFAHPGDREGHGSGLGEVLHTVQLSSSQQQQVHQIVSQAHAANAPVMAQIRALQQQIDKTLLASGSVTEAQLLPLVQQQETLRQKIDVSRLQSEIAVRNLLTGAQLAQAAATQAQLATLHQQEHALMGSAAMAGPPPE